MKSPSIAELETVKRLLAYEGGDHEHVATAVARVYEKLHERLAPLIGSAGVRALFARSLKRAELTGFVFHECGAADRAADSGKQLDDYLHRQESGQAAEAAAVVLATFFALLTMFIGERLTRQILRGAWPDSTEAARKETDK